MIFRNLLLLAIFPMILSCASKSYIESFFRGENDTQYFIRPIGLKSKTIDMNLDFTYRTNDSTKTTLNFTLLPKEKLKSKISGFSIFVNSDTIQAENITSLFQKRSEKIYRFSSEISNTDFDKIVKNENRNFELMFSDNTTVQLLPSKNFNKAMKAAQEDIYYDESGIK